MTKILDLTDKLSYHLFLETASRSLQNGKIIAFPTETVYGLGANAEDSIAVSRLYEIKQRPKGKKTTLLVASVDCITPYVSQVPLSAEKLINKFWPGPLTLVLPGKDGEDIGLRIPNHKVINDLLRIAKIPIAAPSANMSGQPPATNANAVLKAFKDTVDIILDYGPTIGKSSTVVRVNKQGTEILRHGALSDKDIYDCIA